MEGYFRRNGARDWDWISWHNYISWISRSHPHWFQLFSECSKQMGIDWDVMYQTWLASNPKAVEPTPVFGMLCFWRMFLDLKLTYNACILFLTSRSLSTSPYFNFESTTGASTSDHKPFLSYFCSPSQRSPSVV